MGVPRKYDHDKILEAYRTKTRVQVAMEFGCSIWTVRDIASMNSFAKVNKQAILDKTKAIIVERISNPHLTLQSIGDKYEVTRERVRQILENAGVPTTYRNYHKKKVANG